MEHVRARSSRFLPSITETTQCLVCKVSSGDSTVTDTPLGVLGAWVQLLHMRARCPPVVHSGWKSTDTTHCGVAARVIRERSRQTDCIRERSRQTK